jgi:hypothetical protein
MGNHELGRWMKDGLTESPFANIFISQSKNALRRCMAARFARAGGNA